MSLSPSIILFWQEWLLLFPLLFIPSFQNLIFTVNTKKNSTFIVILAKFIFVSFSRFQTIHKSTLFSFADSEGQCQKWDLIYTISVGLAKGLDHLHSGLHKPVVHGNLMSKNVLLDRHCQPYVSDFGLHLLLNPTAGQQMLEGLASQGYKAPELIKMKDASEQTDIYSLGVIFLELLTGKEPINENPTTPHDDFYLPNFMRNAVLGHRVSDLFHPNIRISSSDSGSPVTEERILKLFQLALACCSPSPSLRPNIKQVLRKLEEIGQWEFWELLFGNVTGFWRLGYSFIVLVHFRIRSVSFSRKICIKIWSWEINRNNEWHWRI